MSTCTLRLYVSPLLEQLYFLNYSTVQPLGSSEPRNSQNRKGAPHAFRHFACQKPSKRGTSPRAWNQEACPAEGILLEFPPRSRLLLKSAPALLDWSLGLKTH